MSAVNVIQAVNRGWIARETVTLLALAAVAGCSSAPSRATEDTAAATVVQSAADSLRAEADRGRVEGDTAAPLWLIIASDFQCPFCAQWHRQSQDSLRQEYVVTGKVRVAYLNFPLDHHRHARVAATAALCAGAQNRFWQVHDAIFATQERWTPMEDASALFDSLAGAAGLDITAWRGCVSEGVMDPLVRSDRDRAASAGVQSTPTFLLLTTTGPARPGQLVRGAMPLAEMKHVLDSTLAASGVP